MRKLLLILTLLTSAHLALAQQPTPYQKKCYTLTVSFFKKLGVDEALLKKSDKLSDLENLFLAADVLNKLNTERGIMLLLAYQREMKESESLKTSIDFQRDKERKEKEQEAARLKEAEKQKQLALLEEERLEKEKIARYNNSDFVQLNNQITEEFKKWTEKGEFEKTNDYEQRIKDSTQSAFERICYGAFQERIKDYQNENEDVGFDFKLEVYNADKEEFSIEIKYKDLQWNDVINVPIDKAPSVKEAFHFGNISCKNWGFFENELFPGSIMVTESRTNKQFEFKFPKTLNELKVQAPRLASVQQDDIEFSLPKYEEKLEKQKAELALKQKLYEEERKRKEAAEMERKRLQLEKDKQEREVQVKKEKENASNYGQLKKVIKTQFETWLQKKEMETQQQFEYRVKNNYKAEFDKIVETETVASKYMLLNSRFFAKLGAYNADVESFEVAFDESASVIAYGKVNNGLSAVYDANIAIRIPQGLAQRLKADYSSYYSKTILAYVLDVQMKDNYWVPTKMIFVIPNDASAGVDQYSMKDLHIEQKDDKYILAFAPNYSYKPVKLKNIDTQFKESSLGKGVFYSLWQQAVEKTTPLDFTLENLGITLPF